VNPLSADESTAFSSNSGFTPAAADTFLTSSVFVVMLLWGVWAMRTAYVGWAEDRITSRQFVAVIIRFVAMYLVLTFMLLS
jgi:integrating conjugative element protein (TIGR03758 family)